VAYEIQGKITVASSWNTSTEGEMRSPLR